MKRTLVQKLGLLGIVSFLSCTAAVVFSPLAYPGYRWMAQAVSDLSAANAPSLLSAAETVSKSLHNWTPPLACGYGRMTLAPQYPWISKDGKISIILNAQSVLQ